MKMITHFLLPYLFAVVNEKYLIGTKTHMHQAMFIAWCR